MLTLLLVRRRRRSAFSRWPTSMPRAGCGPSRIAAALARRVGRRIVLPVLAVLVLGVAVRCCWRFRSTCPALRRKLVSDGVLAAFRKVLPPMSQTERDAIEAGTVWWDGELFSGQPDWAKLLGRAAAEAHRRGAALSRQRVRRALRHGQRLGDDARLPRPAAARLAVHQGPRLSRHDHPEGVRRPGLLRVRAFAGGDQALIALRARSSVTVMVPNSLGPGELLMHYGTDEQKQLLPAAARQGPRDPLLRADQPVRGLRRGGDSRLRHRLHGRVRGQARRSACALTWEKRYITLGPVATMLGLAFRAFDPDHLLGDKEDLGITCALIPTDPSGRQHRPPPHAAQRGVPERPELGQGRLHSDRLGDRRPGDDRQGLADADGMSRRGPRDLAAVVQHRHGEARRARDRRLRARAHAVQDADRQVRRRRGAARAHGRQPVHRWMRRAC